MPQETFKKSFGVYVVPFDDGRSRVVQHFLPVLESRLVLLGLVPTQRNYADRITTTDQIVVTNLNKNSQMLV